MREHPKSNDAPDALLLKAELLEGAGRPAEAEKTYVKLAADYPDEDEAAGALWRLGWIAVVPRQSRRDDRAVDPPPGRARRAALREAATYWLGRAWERRGDREQAARQFAQLVQDAPRTYYGLLAAKRAPAAPRRARRRRRSRSRPIRSRRSRATRASPGRKRCGRSGCASTPTRRWTS